MAANRDQEFTNSVERAFTAPTDVGLLNALRTFTKASEDACKVFDKVAAYEGFDPKHTLRKFYAKSLTKENVPGTFDISYTTDDGADAKWSIAKRSDFVTDLNFFVGLYCTRGTKLTKIYDKSSEEMQKVIKAKADTYGMRLDTDLAPRRGRQRELPEPRITRDTITLARLAACVPHIVCDYYKTGVGRELVDFPAQKSKAWIKFPASLRHNLLGALWPDDETTFDRRVAYLMAYFVDEKVNPKKRQSKETIMTYQDIAIQSGFYSIDFKLAVLKDMGIPNTWEYDAAGGILITPTPEFDTMVADMAKYWDDLPEPSQEGKKAAEKVEATVMAQLSQLIAGITKEAK